MNKFILILLLLFSIHFWGFIFIPQTFHNITNILALLIMGISFIRTLQKEGLQFKNAIVLFLIGIFINIYSAYINQGQAPMDTFIAFGTSYLFILYYFLLHDLQPSRKFIENTIIIFAILYSLFYIFQVLKYPNLIFDSGISEDRETIRLRIEGNGFLMLAYFLLLNRYFLNHRLINLLFGFGFLIILLMGGFRTLIFVAILLSGLMIIKFVKYSIKNYAVLVLFFLFAAGLFYFQGTSRIINEMLLASNEQKDEGSDYIRFTELDYYLNAYPQNISYFIIGGGLPGYKSDYGRKMEVVNMVEGLFWDDIGLIGFYIVIGAITLSGLLWYTVKAIFIKAPPYNLYISIYFLYLLIVSFTTKEIYRQGIFPVEAIGLYLIDVAYKKNRMQFNIDNLRLKVK